MAPKKTPSHFSAGLAAGALLGIAAALFVNTKKGKQMTAEVEVKAKALQAKLMKKIQVAEELTKEKYTEVVDQIMDHYIETKEIAKTEIPVIRAFLMKKWSMIEKQIKSLTQ